MKRYRVTLRVYHVYYLRFVPYLLLTSRTLGRTFCTVRYKMKIEKLRVKGTGQKIIIPRIRIRIETNADPDPTILVNADPDLVIFWIKNSKLLIPRPP
jgi:hypothetical protein